MAVACKLTGLARLACGSRQASGAKLANFTTPQLDTCAALRRTARRGEAGGKLARRYLSPRRSLRGRVCGALRVPPVVCFFLSASAAAAEFDADKKAEP